MDDGNGDDLEARFHAEYARAQEEHEFERANARRVIALMEEQHIPMDYFKVQMELRPFGKETFSTIARDMAQGIEDPSDEPMIRIVRRANWLQRIAGTLPQNATEKKMFDEDSVSPGRIREPYTSKIDVQIDIVKDPHLSKDWKGALVTVIDTLTPGISLDDFTPDEQKQIIHDGDMRNMNRELARIYEKYARKALRERLKEYAGHEDFAGAVTGFATALAYQYVPEDLRDEDAVRDRLTFARYHLSNMGLTETDPAVQKALEEAKRVLKEL